MNRAELAEEVADLTGLSKTAARGAVDAVFGVMSKTMCDGEPVRITGFGTFAPKPRKGTVRFNPQTRQRIMVPAKAVPAFKPGTELKTVVSRKLKVVESGDELSLVKAVR